MANSVNYQHFKTLWNVCEKACPEKNKNACQNAVAEIWKIRKKIIHHLMNCKKGRLQSKQMEGIINHKKIQNNLFLVWSTKKKYQCDNQTASNSKSRINSK